MARARELIASGAAAETAWHDAAAETAEQLRALDDPLLAGRAVDVEDVGARVVAALTGAGPALALEGVIVDDELTPRETAALDPQLVRAIATARGTPTAHAAILARALGLPGVVGLGPAVLAIPGGHPGAARRRRGHGAGGAGRAGRGRRPRAGRGRPRAAAPRGSTPASPR